MFVECLNSIDDVGAHSALDTLAASNDGTMADFHFTFLLNQIH